MSARTEATRRWAEGRDLFRYLATCRLTEDLTAVSDRMHKYELTVVARLLTAEGRPDQALELLEAVLPVAERRVRPGLVIEIHVLCACALQAMGDLDRAMCALARALALGEAEGYVRVFLDEGEPLVRLLRNARTRGIVPRYVARLLAAVESGSSALDRCGSPTAPASTHPPTLLEPLTARELDVLRLLPTHLSSSEIAAELYVSANTVRSHIKNIYNKLAVHRRSDAVARARELRLLP